MPRGFFDPRGAACTRQYVGTSRIARRAITAQPWRSRSDQRGLEHAEARKGRWGLCFGGRSRSLVRSAGLSAWIVNPSHDSWGISRMPPAEVRIAGVPSGRPGIRSTISNPSGRRLKCCSFSSGSILQVL